ncbi:MAG TPA: hypothetical protein V6C58_13065, partial [Allocoleopsis sp.]
IDTVVTLLFIFLAFTFLIALIPGFRSMVNTGLSNASGLNCATATDYNSTLGESSTIGCLAIGLFIPFIVLGTLVVFVYKLFYGRSGGGGAPISQYSGYGG